MSSVSAELDLLVRENFSDKSINDRSRLMRQVADLFCKNAPVVSDAQIELFNKVLLMLIDEVDGESRRLLSNSLASIDNVPVEVVKNLSKDADATVAGPLLTQSKCLDDEFLVQCVKTQDQEHLLAISSRETIGVKVTDILLSRGDDQVVLAVAQNTGAEISEGGYSLIVDRALNCKLLASAIFKQPTFPRLQILKLINNASDALCQKLLDDCGSSGKGLLSAINSASKILKEYNLKQSELYLRAEKRVNGLVNTGRVSQVHIAQFARDREFEAVITAITKMSKLPLSEVEEMFFEDQSDRVLIALRAIGLPWPTVCLIFGLNPSSQKSSEQMQLLQTKYQSIKSESAVKALRFSELRQIAQGR